MPAARQNKTLRWCKGGDQASAPPGEPAPILRCAVPGQIALDRQDETVRAVLRHADLRSYKPGDQSPSGVLLVPTRCAATARLDLPSQWPGAYRAPLKEHRHVMAP